MARDEGRPDLERFLFRTRWDLATGCLLWTDEPSVDKNGYGRFWADGKSWLAHRWIFREMHGYLPEVVMHRCDTPGCVEWKRCLLPGTQAENMSDCFRKGRHPYRPGEGHPNAKLSDLQVEKIRTLYRGGMTQRQIGEAYGVAQQHVSKIVRGQQRQTPTE